MRLAARIGSVLALLLVWLLLTPSEAWAWGPGTHVALSETVLSSLHLLPPALQALLARFPLHFIYGSVAADISLAKKYVPAGRHCHNWHVGKEILEAAETDALRAVGWGYLSHLAADTVAHNVFVPRQLLVTSTTQGLGHAYWEHRMDMHVGDDYMGKARRLVTLYDHTDADDLMSAILSGTIFSFQTNRRIFRGMIRIQDAERWRQVFDRMLQKSRFDLPDPLVDRYQAISFDYIVGYLRDGEKSRAWHLDPIGDLNLRLAKKVRRRVLAADGSGDREVLEEAADEFFPFPEESLRFWPERNPPPETRRLLATPAQIPEPPALRDQK
jgi:hypothetical protein